MNKLQKIIGVGIMALELTSCIPPKLEYSGNIGGEQVTYLENLVLDGDIASYDTFSSYEINVIKKDGIKIKYICRSNHGELILNHVQIINGEMISNYYKDKVLSANIIKKGQIEVNNYIKIIQEEKNK